MKIAIIGTREPSEDQRVQALRNAQKFSGEGHTIATGGAHGIDHVAMRGCEPGKLQVYLPWLKYNEGIIPDHAERIVYNPALHQEWMASVDKYHPDPDALSRGARFLMARNYGIILGCELVLAYPKHGHLGGTGQGIRIARGLGIEVKVFA
jgi:DNA recombination-mediator protein A